MIYLNEAFKKLKACENSNDMWYLLLNSAMNYIAKNIFWFLEEKLYRKVSCRINEEIILRALKYHRKNLKDKTSFKLSSLLNHLITLRKVSNISQCLRKEKEVIKGRGAEDEHFQRISVTVEKLRDIVNIRSNNFDIHGFQFCLYS